MRKLILLVIISVYSFVLPGCWDQKILENVGIVLQKGVELTPDQKLLVTYSFPAVVGPTSKTPKNEEIIATKGDTMREARADASMSSSRIIEAGKLEQILFSAELARKGIYNILEVYERDAVNPVLAYVVVVDGSPNELIAKTSQLETEPSSALYINRLLENNVDDSYIPESRIYNFNISYFAPGLDPITPLIRLESDRVKVIGSALFSGDKMVGQLDIKQTALLLAMMHRFQKTELIFGKSSDENSEKSGIALMLIGGKTKFGHSVKHNYPEIDIDLKFKGYLNEYRWGRVKDLKDQQIIERMIAQKISQACQEVIRYTQQVGSDPIGIGDMIRATHNSYWKRVDWAKEYPKARVNIKVKLNIIQYGAIQ